MLITVNGSTAHAATGGVPLAKEGPVLLLLHGAGMDATVWQQQTRFLAHRGIRVLAVDLPGHGRSEGEPLRSVAAMASWVNDFITAAGFEQVHLAGHSMGTFIALRLAADHPERVTSVVLLGTANAMPVHPDLLDAATNDLPAAAALMAAWGHDKPAHIGRNPTPGMWMIGGARALVENSRPGALTTDFTACMAFEDAETAAAAVQCPATVVIGAGDKMTPPKGGARVANSLVDATVVQLAGAGHMMMLEEPRRVREILKNAVLANA